SDGLGHGAFAAQASTDATRIFASSDSLDADTLAESIHLGLRSTRGAAIAVASIQHSPRVAPYSGIGNIASVLIDDGTARRMVSHNGTAGLVARRIHGFQYPYASGALLVMHTDGLASAWNMDKYPGLAERSPMLIAGVLYRDFARARDDAGVLVARLGL